MRRHLMRVVLMMPRTAAARRQLDDLLGSWQRG